MKRYWLLISNLDNWETIKNNYIYGFNEQNKKYISALNNGDIAVVYVKPKKIGGIFIIERKEFDSDINFKDGNYPYKIKLKKISVPETFLEITDEIVNNISIFKRAMHWGSVLMGRSLREITESDYLYIKSLM